MRRKVSTLRRQSKYVKVASVTVNIYQVELALVVVVSCFSRPTIAYFGTRNTPWRKYRELDVVRGSRMKFMMTNKLKRIINTLFVV